MGSAIVFLDKGSAILVSVLDILNNTDRRLSVASTADIPDPNDAGRRDCSSFLPLL